MWSPKFGLGDKVFAKMRGYPPWPAKVEGVLDRTPSRTRYRVYFYGTKQIATCKQEDLCSYLEKKGVHGKPKKYKGFMESLMEIESELGLATKPQTQEGLNSLSSLSGETNFTTTNKEINQKVLKASACPISKNGLEFCNEIKFYPSSVSCESNPSTNQNVRSDENKLDGSQTQNNKPLISESLEKEHLLTVLKIEAQMVDIEVGIQCSLSLKKADTDACLKYLEAFSELELTPLMIKKHPEIVGTLNKTQNYVGNTHNWDMSSEEIEIFTSKAKEIQAKAKLIFNKIESMFLVPDGENFLGFLEYEVNNLKNCTKTMSMDDFFRLTKDPTINSSNPLKDDESKQA